MVGFLKNMDFRTKHWLGYSRRFPSPYPLASANFVAQKDHWIRHAFDTCNFSVIVRGRGEFHHRGRRWDVVAPCVITQWPGEQVEYGPPIPAETWDEFYFMYEARLMPRFEEAGLIDRSRPVWPIHDLPRVRALLAEFAALAGSATPEQMVDRVDRVAERIVLETVLAPDPAAAVDTALHNLLAELRRDFATRIDLDALAARHGLSRATFRRRWAAVMSLAPARYVQELRMREACRQLVETTQPIREIARAVGFDDELYFSRRFHRELGTPPGKYRQVYALRNGTDR